MSVSNIIFQIDLNFAYFVGFQKRDGSQVLYGFSPGEGAAIEAGADPQTLNGKRIEGIADVASLALGNLSDAALRVAAEALAGFL